MSKAPYTTQLQAGLGLVPETHSLIGLWQPGMDGQALLRAALASGQFPTMTARRLRNIIIEAFAPRYLVDAARPARLLKTLVRVIDPAEICQLFFLYTCRANAILADFVKEVYWGRYASGSAGVSKAETQDFVRRGVGDGKTASDWSESTIVRVSRYLLGACADFGLLGPMRQEARSILPLRPTPLTISFLAHDLHFRGLGDNAMVQHADWRLFGVEPEEVLAELKRLALQGEMIVQSAGSIVQIAWHSKSMQEVADGFARR